MNIFHSPVFLSIKKTERYFACAKSVLVFSRKFLDYQETRLFGFAQYFFNWTVTPDFSRKYLSA